MFCKRKLKDNTGNWFSNFRSSWTSTFEHSIFNIGRGQQGQQQAGSDTTHTHTTQPTFEKISNFKFQISKLRRFLKLFSVFSLQRSYFTVLLGSWTGIWNLGWCHQEAENSFRERLQIICPAVFPR